MNSNIRVDPLVSLTRRHFFSRCSLGLGSVALASLLQRSSLAAAPIATHPLAPKAPRFTPRAKNIIYLFLSLIHI